MKLCSSCQRQMILGLDLFSRKTGLPLCSDCYLLEGVSSGVINEMSNFLLKEYTKRGYLDVIH